MIWQIPVFLRILTANVAGPFLMKRVVSRGSLTRKLVWQYSFCFLISLVWPSVSLLRGEGFRFDLAALMILLVGAFNGFACYCQWRAVHISLSKTSMFTLLDDLLALLLGYVFLGEQRYLSPLLSVGVLFSLSAVALFSFSKARRQRTKETQPVGRIAPLAIWILLYSAIWGGALFSMRYFGLTGVTVANYVLFWYGGSLIGAVLVRQTFGKGEGEELLAWKEVALVGQLTVAIWLSLASAYWSMTLAPIIVVQPIYQVAEMVLPTIIGLTVFKEAANLRALEKAAMAVGLIGGLVIAISFR